MFTKFSLKNVVIGSAIIFFLTAFIQRILYGSGLIKSTNTLVDLFSWVIAYFVLAIIAMIITKKFENKNTLYLIFAYIIAIIVILATIFGCSFGYKKYKINNYQSVLSIMEEKQATEIETLMKQNKSFVFILTSEDCPYCLDFLPTIKEAVQTSDVIPIYYMPRENDTNSIMKELFDAPKIPFVVRIEDGKIKQNFFENPIDFFE